jgi:hypothetical protein
VAQLVRSFHTSYEQTKFQIRTGSDTYKNELRFSQWTTEMKFSQFRAIVELNHDLKNRPIIVDQLYFQWSIVPDECFLSVMVQKASASQVFHYTKPDYTAKRGIWRPSASREHRVSLDFRNVVSETRAKPTETPAKRARTDE